MKQISFHIKNILLEIIEDELDVTELIDDLSKGKISAQNKFFNYYYNKLKKYILKDNPDYDDDTLDKIVTTAILKGMTKIESFKGASSLDTWMKKITKNLLLDYIRTKQTKKNKLETEIEPEKISNIVTQSFTPRYGEFDNRLLNKFLNTLTEKQKSILTLHIEGFKHKEIGETIGMTTGTVKWHIHDLKNKLKVFLEKIGYDFK